MKRILFFGDSNTYGYEPGEYFGGRYPASVRWPDRLANDLADESEMLPGGMNGRCIPEMPYEKAYVDALIDHAGRLDVFAVMLGTNDVILTHRPNAETAERSMDKFLTYLKERNDLPEILLIAPPAMAEAALADPVMAPYVAETKKLAGLYKALAEKHQVAFADADSWAIDMAFDHAHLSREGHRVFAERMGAYLRAFAPSHREGD